jgi:hypothetical protein
VLVVGLEEHIDQVLQLGDGGWLGLASQPVLQGLLEAFDFAAGGGVVGSGVLLDDVEGVEVLLEPVAASLAAEAGQSDCVDHAVIGQGGCGNSVLTCGFAEAGGHDGGGERPVRGHVQGVAGAVVEPADDLDAPGEGAGVAQRIVGEVGLPSLVRHVRLEPDVGRLRPLLRLGCHESGSGQVAADRGHGHDGVVVLGQVPSDGVGTGVQPCGGEFYAQLDDAVDGPDGDRGRAGVRASGPGLDAASPSAR